MSTPEAADPAPAPQRRRLSGWAIAALVLLYLLVAQYVLDLFMFPQPTSRTSSTFATGRK